MTLEESVTEMVVPRLPLHPDHLEARRPTPHHLVVSPPTQGDRLCLKTRAFFLPTYLRSSNVRTVYLSRIWGSVRY